MTADTSLIEDFADEAREHLEELEHNLLQLASDPACRELLDGIFRSMHTIKGASEYLGFERIARLSHRLENLLDSFRDGRLRADKVAVDLLIDARDRIEELISQVEATGRESSEIDDLLNRAAAIASDQAPAMGEEAGLSEAEPGEADGELFGIFIEQLTGGLAEVVEAAAWLRAGSGILDGTRRMAEQVKRLAGTAHYMGYDALSAVYDDMSAGIEELACRSAEADVDAIDRFLQSTVAGGIDRIRKLFPHDRNLASIDLTELSAAAVDDAPDPLPAQIEPATSEFDRLLVGLPTIDGQNRESLLSNALDATFAAMRSDDGENGEIAEALTDCNPMAMGISPDRCGADAHPARPGSGVDPDGESSRNPDEVGPARKDDWGAVDPGVDNGATNRSSDEGGGLVPLWPEAVGVSDPVPHVPIEETPASVAAPDFSTPRTVNSAVADETEPEPVSARASIRKSIRVDAAKVDELMNQVGELVVNRSTFLQLYDQWRDLTRYLKHRFPMDKADQRRVTSLSARLNDATAVLGRVTGDLQDQVMKVRMLPLSRLFNRSSRLVHDLLKGSDKKIQLQFRGEETELDRVVIEQLADPMIHIIRNAVDHGIETCGEREKKGKPKSGLLLLEAFHEGSHVVIEVTDDGRGLDFSRIRQKAIEKQLADDETLERMDATALADLIMQPGFSTADRITHTSGRGVGMDVVKQNIEKINGSLVVDTRPDVGTRIRIRIPLTLAIIPALMIRCGASHFTVPLSAVQETIRVDQGEIFTVDGSEVMHLYQEPLPLIKLTDLLHMTGPPSTHSDGRFYVVVVQAAAGRIGFVVDALLGRQEVVVKPLEDYVQENSGFSGATILGDGSISLIVDVDELVVMAQQRTAERKLAAAVL